MLIAKNDEYIKKLISDPIYDIRLDGTIWSKRSQQGHITSIWRQVKLTNKNGYLICRYGSKYNQKHLFIHRIIYAKFIGLLSENLVINHINGIKTDNCPKNLELVTQGKNQEHRFRVLKYPPVRANHKLTDLQVKEIRDIYRTGNSSYKKIAKQYNLSKSTICSLIKNKTYKYVS